MNTLVVSCFCLIIVHDHPGFVSPRRATGSTNVGEQLPTGQLSVVPWRRTGVKYTNNEAYFDVVEEIDVIIDKSGTAVSGRRVEPRGCSMVYMSPLLVSFGFSIMVDGIDQQNTFSLFRAIFSDQHMSNPHTDGTGVKSPATGSFLSTQTRLCISSIRLLLIFFL